MTSELHKSPLEPAPAATAPAKVSWREQRQIRRRRRVWFEEILGWILVPIIVVGCYWLFEATLNALGTSTEAILTGIRSILANF